MKELELVPMDETVETKHGGEEPDQCGGSDDIFDSIRAERVKNTLNETDEMLSRATAWAAKISVAKGDMYDDRIFKRSLIEIYAHNYQVIRNSSF